MLCAISLLAEIENGARSAAEIVEACSARIDAEDGLIGAFEYIDAAAALREATAAEGPLRGLPVVVKDVFDTADMPTGYGSQIYDGHRPRTDAAIISQIRRAGGSVLGKTVTTEFAFFEPGRTRNPRNPAHTPGGSSSGSAAAIAAGMAPLAIGTQTGGSTVRPTGFCGIAGYKPSFGLLPTVGMKIFSWSLDTVGLFGAGVGDVAMFAAALSGRDLAIADTAPRPLRIGVVRTHLWHEASGEMRAAVGDAARYAANAGAEVDELHLAGDYAEAFSAHQVIQDYEASRALAFEHDRHGDLLSAILRDTLDAGRAVSAESYDAAKQTARAARKDLDAIFVNADVLLTPSAPGAAPEGLGSTGSSIFNRLWTLMGTPAVNVPGIENDKGLPLGVQIVGPIGKDRDTLAAASWLEQVLADAAT